jgi:glutathione S-transferase
MTLGETNTPYEFTLVDFAKGEHKAPPHLGRQPFGQVPTLDDDGFAFYESRAICRYINEKANGELVPADIKGRALTEQWISIEIADFSPHLLKLIAHHLFQQAQEPAVLAAAEKGLETALGVMDTQLANTPFLAGTAFTLADICYMPYIEYGMATPAKEMFPRFPHVSAWWSKISQRPTWLKAAGRA